MSQLWSNTCVLFSAMCCWLPVWISSLYSVRLRQRPRVPCGLKKAVDVRSIFGGCVERKCLAFLAPFQRVWHHKPQPRSIIIIELVCSQDSHGIKKKKKKMWRWSLCEDVQFEGVFPVFAAAFSHSVLFSCEFLKCLCVPSLSCTCVELTMSEQRSTREAGTVSRAQKQDLWRHRPETGGFQLCEVEEHPGLCPRAGGQMWGKRPVETWLRGPWQRCTNASWSLYKRSHV